MQKELADLLAQLATGKAKLTLSSDSVLLVIDASSDGHRAAYAALAITWGEKPRFLYASRHGIPLHTVERWGIRSALRRIGVRFGAHRPVVLVTDNQPLAAGLTNGRVRGVWLPRETLAIRRLHRAANALRRALPDRRPPQSCGVTISGARSNPSSRATASAAA